MVILWLCNSPTPYISSMFDIPTCSKEGWLVDMSERISNCIDTSLIYVFPWESDERIKEQKVGKNIYIMVSPDLKSWEYESILNKYVPDIIHIWGSEYSKTLEMVRASSKCNVQEKVVISIQGLVGAFSYHYMGNIPGKYQIIPSLRDVIRKDSLNKQLKSFVKRGKDERKALQLVNHVIGRTFWDYNYAKLVNPNINYHFNNETLRASFYKNGWKKETCVKHRIFVTQASYPLKGFHYLLQAVALIKDRYPDVSIVVSGADNSFKSMLLETSYGKYLRLLMKKEKLTDFVRYIGMLDEEEMLKQYLKAEVFVSPSSIENSPNSVGEAMLLGMPVISSNVGGVADLLEHNKEGFLYQADAPYLLAYYITCFFENEDLEIQMGEAARVHAKSTHDAEKNYKSLIEIYRNIQENLNEA